MTRAETQRRLCTCFVLRKLTRRVTQAYDRALAGAGLTITQYSVLAHLQHQPGRSLPALAEAMGMDRTSLIRTMRPVLDAGWARQKSTRAARAAAIELTAAGLAKLRAAQPLWMRVQREIGALLGERRVAALHALAGESLDALGTARAA